MREFEKKKNREICFPCVEGEFFQLLVLRESFFSCGFEVCFAALKLSFCKFLFFKKFNSQFGSVVNIFIKGEIVRPCG